MTDTTIKTDHPAITAEGAPAGDGITLYGAPWCGDTRRSKALLDRLGVPYADVDIDQSPAATAWITAQRGGERRIPTIVLGPGQPLLFEPTDDELESALVRVGYLRG